MQILTMPTEVHISFTDDGSFAAHVDLTNLGEVEEMAERGRGLPLASAPEVSPSIGVRATRRLTPDTHSRYL